MCFDKLSTNCHVAVPFALSLSKGEPAQREVCVRRSLVRDLIHRLFDLLLPQRCVSCGVLGENFCPPCIAQITASPALHCALCTAAVARPYTLCQSCRRTYPRLRGIVAAGAFGGPLRHAIHHFKYRSRTSLAQELGALLSQTVIEAEMPPCATIVPVPLHPKRETARGFNQAALVAGEVSRRLHASLDREGIARVVDTPPQVGLSRAQRLRNVANAFAARPGAYSNGGVLLIDDVATTGATLVTCARQITREGGAPWVWGAVLARDR